MLAQRLRNMTESIIGQLRKKIGLFRGISKKSADEHRPGT